MIVKKMIFVGLLSTLLFTGCANKVTSGAFWGATFGGIAGGTEGAVIGGVSGAMIGAINESKDRDKYYKERDYKEQQQKAKECKNSKK